MTLDQLRAAAVAQTLFAPTTLPAALRRFGFVQADPIRAPARAQDLILRHRVRAYRAGDLERRYAKLSIEEGTLYAYGFLSDETFAVLNPRALEPDGALEQRVLAIVREHGPLHPSEMKRWFGRDRVVNDWGGQSLETTRTLEQLRRRGLLRVSHRTAGVRVYQATTPSRALESGSEQSRAPDRVRALLRIVIGLLGPVPETTLSGIAAKLVSNIPSPGGHRPILRTMLREADFRREEIDGVVYWRLSRRMPACDFDRVRFLAPFDPIVWDRKRFEHLWGWPHRFEAYVPSPKRERGYYALPLLWRTDVIGWVNARAAGDDLAIEFGYVASKPRERAFVAALAEEIERLRVFLRRAV